MTARRDPMLPLPNPEDWLTRGGAAELLDVDHTTVTRMVNKGRLTAYYPRGDGREGKRDERPVMFWRPEVATLAEARRVARHGVKAA